MSRSSRHVARDRITSSRLSRQLASGGVPFIFHPGIRSSPVIALPTITVLKATRIVFWRSLEYTFPSPFSLPHTRSLIVSLPSSFSLFFPPSPPPARHPSHPFAFLRVVRAYEFDFTRFPSIGEHRKLFLEQPISPFFGPVPRLLSPVPPVPLLPVPVAGSLSSSFL